MERYAKSDGYISADEARRINAAQNRANRHIHGESRDHQRAWWRRTW
jgi:hypothetical protein